MAPRVVGKTQTAVTKRIPRDDIKGRAGKQRRQYTKKDLKPCKKLKTNLKTYL